MKITLSICVSMPLRTVFLICVFRRNVNHDSRILLSAVPVKSFTVSVEAVQRGRIVLADRLDGNCCVLFYGQGQLLCERRRLRTSGGNLDET